MQKLTATERQDYINNVLVPWFKPLIEQPVYSCIYNDNLEVVICTQKSAQGLGLSKWEEVVGLGYKRSSELARKICGAKYTDENQQEIIKYSQVILDLQAKVFQERQVVTFFDLLPYNSTFQSHIVIYTPIFHPNGEVVALQSFSHESKFFGFQEHFFKMASEPLAKEYPLHKDLSRREQEIMFLLANGLSQEHIAKTLGLSRSTIASIIANQLSEKFNIPGANTQLLSKIAIEAGYFQYIPESLYRPFVVSLLPE